MIWTLPNIITVTRIVLTPIVAVLPFLEGWIPKLGAFIVFLMAAISDMYDGRLARERNQVTDFGKLMDPLADKLLLFAMLIPIYILSKNPTGMFEFPWWGALPMYAVVILVGREVFMTVFRQVAKSKGVVIAADWSGKIKTAFQSIFLGAAIAWFAWRDMQAEYGWEGLSPATVWNYFHGFVIAVSLAVALVLTVTSLLGYLYRYRSLFVKSAN
ncbi:MAG: CDP-alcohol phosphatidyltransferase family protein [Gemmatimonadota bacterium]|nr:CDP-alcohol phosphatidyltransferase family protein [Gemmatimonadota bacterium]MDH5803711.1 CDP-alcohol phosphatidyltransferase family protein [Gemmatimonadota bacterium]